jgi:glutamyl-tRNA synthetase
MKEQASIHSVRTRFAPSPTGEIHLGSLRTALFNYLYAKKHKGSFVLRIEDTDAARAVPNGTKRIIDALTWAGLPFDEGPDVGGACGPYIQSQRSNLYQEHARDLIKKKNAYYCFCTPERLHSVRAQQHANRQPPRYDGLCRTLSEQEVNERLHQKMPHVIRASLPHEGSVVVHDLIHGDVVYQYEELDDSVLVKSDGMPTYHLAVVVDDHLMNITHVMRSEEWLPSTPKHLFLYGAFGWEPPAFAHLPAVLSPKGGKLSKRDGAVSVVEYQRKGYLPEAIINYLALVGWNPKTDQELFSLDELVRAFSLEGVHRAGGVFDIHKLDFLNGKYIRSLTPEQLLAKAGEWGKRLQTTFPGRAARVVSLVQDRMKTLDDLTRLSTFLLVLPEYHAELLIEKHSTKERTKDILITWKDYYTTLESTRSDADAMKRDCLQFIRSRKWSNAESLWPLRVAVAGSEHSPDVFRICEIIGNQEVQNRIHRAIQKIERSTA